MNLEDFHIRYCLLGLDAVVNAKAEKIRQLVANQWIELFRGFIEQAKRNGQHAVDLSEVYLHHQHDALPWKYTANSIRHKVSEYFQTQGCHVERCRISWVSTRSRH